MARKKGFKKGVDQDDSRRRRTETTIQIRKEKKDDQIQKRRGVSSLVLHGNTILFHFESAVHRNILLSNEINFTVSNRNLRL